MLSTQMSSCLLISQNICNKQRQMRNFQAEMKDPFAIMVEAIAKDLSAQLLQFGKRCRNYIKEHHTRNPEFTKMFPSQTVKANSNLAESSQANLPDDSKPKQPKPRKKDDDLPLKRPRSVYNLFVASQSIKIKEQNPHMRATDIVRISAERFKNLTPEEKQPYIDKFEQTRRMFDEQENESRFGVSKLGKSLRNDYAV